MTTDAWLMNYLADRLRQVGVDGDTATTQAAQMKADITAAFNTIHRLETACDSAAGRHW